MIFDKIDLILNDARQETKGGKWVNAEVLYTKAINEIQHYIKSVDFRKKETWTIKLWVTKAEFLYFESINPKRGETFEDCRNKRLDCLRYLYKCSKLNGESQIVYQTRLIQDLNDTILKFGCILPEKNNQVIVSCPIYLGKIPFIGGIPFNDLGTSIAFSYEKATCSICKRDMLDEECDHVPGETYNGEKCIMTVDDYKPIHLALVKRPKEPMAGFGSFAFSKESCLERLQPEDRKRKIEENLPFVCFLCRDQKMDTAEITPELFFKMQELPIEIE